MAPTNTAVDKVGTVTDMLAAFSGGVSCVLVEPEPLVESELEAEVELEVEPEPEAEVEGVVSV